jgi:YVTN family beta-propeller protein
LGTAAAIATLALCPAPAAARVMVVPLNGGATPTSVQRFETSTNTLVPPAINVGGEAVSVVITPDGTKAYVTVRDNDTTQPDKVVRVNLLNVGDTKDIAVGIDAFAMALNPDGSRLYAVNFRSNSVTVINTATDEVIVTRVLPTAGNQPDSVAVSPDGTKAYVSIAFPSGHLRRLDTATNTFVGAAIPVASGSESAREIVFKPDGSAAYVGLLNGSTGVKRINPANDTVASTFVPGFTDPGALAVTPDGARLFGARGSNATSGIAGLVTANDAALGAPFPVTVGANISGLAMMPDGSRAYMLDVTQDFLRSINLTTGALGPSTSVNVGPTSARPAIVPNQGPTASFTVSPAGPGVPVQFNASGSSDADGSVVRYDWDFGDGAVQTTGSPSVAHTYQSVGQRTARLTVTDNEGGSTQRVFDGVMTLQNGGSRATTTRTVNVGIATPTPTPTPVPTATASPIPDVVAATTTQPSPTTTTPPAAAPQRIFVTLAYNFAAKRKTTKLSALRVNDVPAGSDVIATCSPRCPKARVVKRNQRGTVRLKELVTKPLRFNAVITVTVTKAGMTGAVKVLAMRSRKAPKVTTKCLPLGARKPAAC